MTLLQKYIFREWFWTFLAVTVVLLIVMIGVSLGELLNDIADGRVPSGLLWALIGLKMPEVMTTILPLSVFIAVIWGLGRLYRDQEMAVMRASGFRWQPAVRFPIAGLGDATGDRPVPGAGGFPAGPGQAGRCFSQRVRVGAADRPVPRTPGR